MSYSAGPPAFLEAYGVRYVPMIEQFCPHDLIAAIPDAESNKTYQYDFKDKEGSWKKNINDFFFELLKSPDFKKRWIQFILSEAFRNCVVYPTQKDNQMFFKKFFKNHHMQRITYQISGGKFKFTITESDEHEVEKENFTQTQVAPVTPEQHASTSDRHYESPFDYTRYPTTKPLFPEKKEPWPNPYLNG